MKKFSLLIKKNINMKSERKTNNIKKDFLCKFKKMVKNLKY